jgi:hypothetical protein
MNLGASNSLEATLRRLFAAGDFPALSATLLGNADFVRRLRLRVRAKLDMREMLYPDQTFYVVDAEHDALEFIADRALLAPALAEVLRTRGAVNEGSCGREGGGGTFDPTRGSIVSWILRAADYQLQDWLKGRRAGGHRKAVVTATATIETLPSQNLLEAAEEVQAERLRATQLLLASRFRTLSLMRRACMIVKYLSTAADGILTSEDLECIWRVRNGQHELTLTVSIQRELRRDLELLVADETEWSAGDSQTTYRAIADKVEYLFAKSRRLMNSLDYQSRELRQRGWSDDSLRMLAQRGEQSTLEEIAARHQNRWTAERCFEELSQRYRRVTIQLEKLRAEFRVRRDSLTPSTGQIARFLNATANAVSTALSKAHREIGCPLAFSDHDDVL